MCVCVCVCVCVCWGGGVMSIKAEPCCHIMSRLMSFITLVVCTLGLYKHAKRIIKLFWWKLKKATN